MWSMSAFKNIGSDNFKIISYLRSHSIKTQTKEDKCRHFANLKAF